MRERMLYMETTQISAERTSAEITALLVRAAARQISLSYAEDGSGSVTGLHFVLAVKGILLPFALPVRVNPIYQLLIAKGRNRTRPKETRAQAERVAWRQLLRWMQAQLAMIDTGMVDAHEVFLPYLLNPAGSTMFEAWKESGLRQLGAAETGK